MEEFDTVWSLAGIADNFADSLYSFSRHFAELQPYLVVEDGLACVDSQSHKQAVLAPSNCR